MYAADLKLLKKGAVSRRGTRPVPNKEIDSKLGQRGMGSIGALSKRK